MQEISGLSPVKILLVIPVYNNAATLARVVARALDFTSEVLVVDDGSTDATHANLRGFKLKVLRHAANRGKGAALKSAFEYGRVHGYTHTITMDADGQHHSEDLPSFVAAIRENPRCLVIGCRRLHGEKMEAVPFASRFGRQFSNFWVAVETGYWLKDTQSGFRAYPLESLPTRLPASERYDFEIEILVHYLWNKTAVVEIPIEVFYPSPLARVSHFHGFYDNLRLSRLHTALCMKRIIWSAYRCVTKVKEIFVMRRNAEFRGARLLAWLMRTFGVQLCYWLLPGVVLVYYLLAHRERRALSEFYRRLPKTRATEKPRTFLKGYWNFYYFAMSLIDRIGFATHVNPYSGFNVSDQEGFSPRGALLLGAHVGDWFCSAQALASRELMPISIVIDGKKTPEYARLLRTVGEKRLQFIDASGPRLDFVLQVREAILSGGAISFLGDRSQPGEVGLVLSLLGGKVRLPLAPYNLAKRLGAPVIAFFAFKKGRGATSGFKVVYELLYDGKEEVMVEELAGRYAAMLEKIVIAYPWQWFNFYDYWKDESATETGEVAKPTYSH